METKYMVYTCCVCGKITKKIPLSDERYKACLEGAPERYKDKDIISHGFCTPCFDKKMAEMDGRTK